VSIIYTLLDKKLSLYNTQDIAKFQKRSQKIIFLVFILFLTQFYSWTGEIFIARINQYLWIWPKYLQYCQYSCSCKRYNIFRNIPPRTRVFFCVRIAISTWCCLSAHFGWTTRLRSTFLDGATCAQVPSPVAFFTSHSAVWGEKRNLLSYIEIRSRGCSHMHASKRWGIGGEIVIELYGWATGSDSFATFARWAFDNGETFLVRQLYLLPIGQRSLTRSAALAPLFASLSLYTREMREKELRGVKRAPAHRPPRHRINQIARPPPAPSLTQISFSHSLRLHAAVVSLDPRA